MTLKPTWVMDGPSTDAQMARAVLGALVGSTGGLVAAGGLSIVRSEEWRHDDPQTDMGNGRTEHRCTDGTRRPWRLGRLDRRACCCGWTKHSPTWYALHGCADRGWDTGGRRCDCPRHLYDLPAAVPLLERRLLRTRHPRERRLLPSH